jgi:hypothetical protein
MLSPYAPIGAFFIPVARPIGRSICPTGYMRLFVKLFFDHFTSHSQMIGLLLCSLKSASTQHPASTPI